MNLKDYGVHGNIKLIKPKFIRKCGIFYWERSIISNFNIFGKDKILKVLDSIDHRKIINVRINVFKNDRKLHLSLSNMFYQNMGGDYNRIDYVIRTSPLVKNVEKILKEFKVAISTPLKMKPSASQFEREYIYAKWCKYNSSFKEFAGRSKYLNNGPKPTGEDLEEVLDLESW